MQTITLTTQQIPKPAGRVAGNWRIGLKDTLGNLVRDYSGVVPQVLFEDVANGQYVIFAQRLDTAGAVIDGIERPFTVTDGELVDVPLAILVGGA